MKPYTSAGKLHRCEKCNRTYIVKMNKGKAVVDQYMPEWFNNACYDRGCKYPCPNCSPEIWIQGNRKWASVKKEHQVVEIK